MPGCNDIIEIPDNEIKPATLSLDQDLDDEIDNFDWEAHERIGNGNGDTLEKEIS